MTLHDIIEKISMNDYTQYEIRVMLEEYLPIQRKLIEQAFQDGAEHFGGTMTLPLSHVYYDRKFSKDNYEPFVTEGLLAIPEEHIFDNIDKICNEIHEKHNAYMEADVLPLHMGDKLYMIETAKMLEGETPQQAIDRLGLKPIGE